MYDKRLARAILGKLDELFPQQLHLYQLQAALPEFKNASPQAWHAAVEALKCELHVDGNFLKAAPGAVANLRITPLGRRDLRGSASVASIKPDGGTFLNLTSLQKDLLVAIVDRHLSNNGAPYMFAQSHSGSGLGPNGPPAPPNTDGSDFHQLQREGFLTVEMVGPNVIRGKPTQLGIETAGSLRGNQAGHANSAPRDSQRSGPAQKDSTAAYSESGQLIAEAFKEDASARPLGENPFPSEHPAHEPFEEGTWVAKRSLNRVRLKTLNSIPNPEADLVQAILTFRVRMFSPCAFGALLIVGNEETGGVYERLIDKLAEYTLHDTLQKGQLKDPRANPASHPLFRPEILPRMEGDLKLALMKAVTHYKGRAAKRVLQSMQMRRTLAGESEQRASESTKISAAASYPERASWFQNELAVREWSVHDFQAQGGPDWKTSRKILDGLSVSRGVLEKTAAALSKKKKRVLLRDIPQT